MKFLRRTAGYTLFDHKRNKEILAELKVEPADEKLCTFSKTFTFKHKRFNI
jgi:hypothetical protein